jgi:hypothetical protein
VPFQKVRGYELLEKTSAVNLPLKETEIEQVPASMHGMF